MTRAAATAIIDWALSSRKQLPAAAITPAAAAKAGRVITAQSLSGQLMGNESVSAESPLQPDQQSARAINGPSSSCSTSAKASSPAAKLAAGNLSEARWLDNGMCHQHVVIVTAFMAEAGGGPAAFMTKHAAAWKQLFKARAVV